MGGTGARSRREQEPAHRTKSSMRRNRSLESFSCDIRSPQDRFARRLREGIEQGSDSGPHTPAPGPILRRVRSPQDRFVRRVCESIEQGSDSGPHTPAPGPILRRVPLDYAQHPRGTPVRVQHEKPGKPPRLAHHQQETRQANINRALATWCEQERERAITAEREGALLASKGGELHGFALTNVAVGVTKSRFATFAMLSAMWMAINTCLGSWAQRLRSMLMQPAVQLVPGLRAAGSSRGPQTKLERCKEELRLAELALERRKEELRHAENALAQGQLEVLQAEIRVASIAREERLVWNTSDKGGLRPRPCDRFRGLDSP